MAISRTLLITATLTAPVPADVLSRLKAVLGDGYRSLRVAWLERA